jgi:2,4-dienoyl-CoA reductase-like NADH-dependent reductase (Old Yellow Enzyme family)
MAQLFSGLHLRTITFKNRVFVSPMCQYSSVDGMPNDWHLVHLGSRAVGGAALVIVEATAVSPEGRVSPWDTGIWSDAQAVAFERITEFIKAQGAVACLQLAHAGRKASTDLPWRGGAAISEKDGGWQPLAPSAVAFDGNSPMPRAMNADDIEAVTDRFASAAKRCLAAGFEVVELHMGHGYLLHEFLSPLSNLRDDEWGVSPEGRFRFPLKVVEAVRNVWPERLPLFVRISCTDWVRGGWDLAQSIKLCRHFKERGVDLIDCSSGGLVPDAVIPVGPGYQTPLAAAIRREVGIPTATVGCITSPAQAEQIVATGQADAVAMARELLRDPYWPLHAARSLDMDLLWPPQYRRAKPR